MKFNNETLNKQDKASMAQAFDLNTAYAIREIESGILNAVADRLANTPNYDEANYWKIGAVRNVLDFIVKEIFSCCETKIPGAENFETTCEKDENEFKKHNYDLMIQAIDMLDNVIARKAQKANFGLASYGPGAIITEPILPLARNMLADVAAQYKESLK